MQRRKVQNDFLAKTTENTEFFTENAENSVEKIVTVQVRRTRQDKIGLEVLHGECVAPWT